MYNRTGGWKGPEVDPACTAQRTCVFRNPQTLGSQTIALFVATVQFMGPMWKERTNY